MIVAPELASAKPYLVRAMYDWCVDQGTTPFISVFVDDRVQVPKEYVREGEITLNIGHEAASALKMDNHTIEFKARFAGVARQLIVPITHVMALYGRESGQGMAFPVSEQAPVAAAVTGLPMVTPAKLATEPSMQQVSKKDRPLAPSTSASTRATFLKRVK